MSDAASQRRYHAAPTAALIIQPLDALTLVYHRPSGITHMVAEPVPQILRAMAGDMLTAAEVTARLSQEFDLGEDAEALITERLRELEQLGLVTEVHDA